MNKHIITILLLLTSTYLFSQQRNISLTTTPDTIVIDSIIVHNYNTHKSTTIIPNTKSIIFSSNTTNTTTQKHTDNPPKQISQTIIQAKQTDIVQLTAYSGKMSTTILLYPNNDTTINFYFEPCIDADGNHYTIMKIGKQLWMVENLKTTHYNNGDPIPNITDNSQWDTTHQGAYRNYYNNTHYVAKYGRLYNWYAVNDKRGIAPKGWYIPNMDEWNTMEHYLLPGHSFQGVGSRLKEWALIPAGYCDPKGGFGMLGSEGFWWLIDEESQNKAWYVFLNYLQSSVSLTSADKNHGFSVRCVKEIK